MFAFLQLPVSQQLTKELYPHLLIKVTSQPVLVASWEVPKTGWTHL